MTVCAPCVYAETEERLIFKAKFNMSGISAVLIPFNECQGRRLKQAS
jgi:hypothetical protein